jgi:hypothetical protein
MKRGELKAVFTLLWFCLGVYSVIQKFPEAQRAWRRLTK